MTQLPPKTAPDYAKTLSRLSGVEVPDKPLYAAKGNRAQRRQFAVLFKRFQRAEKRALAALEATK